MLEVSAQIFSTEVVKDFYQQALGHGPSHTYFGLSRVPYEKDTKAYKFFSHSKHTCLLSYLIAESGVLDLSMPKRGEKSKSQFFIYGYFHFGFFHNIYTSISSFARFHHFPSLPLCGSPGKLN